MLDQPVLQHLCHVEYVKTGLLCKNQRISHKLLHALCIVILHKVVIGVRCVDLIVFRMVKHR